MVKAMKAVCLQAGLLSLLLLGACSKDSNTPSEPANDPEPVTGNTIAQGNFSGNRNYQVSGVAKVLDQNSVKVLRLENFSSSGGPDLKVYLASDANASRFINLGKLRSLTGNQNYDISGMPSLQDYPYALIWCEQFGVLFGAAILK